MKIKNRIRVEVLALALAVSLAACSSKPASSTAASSQSTASESVASEVSSAPEAESTSGESDTDAQSYVIDGVTFIVRKVPNDVTGNWRFTRVSEGVDMTQYALDYYTQCFNDDSEIHFIIDEDNNTTTKISYVFGNIDVLVKDHVKDEELDAKTLGDGATLSEYFVDKETGEIEKVS